MKHISKILSPLVLLCGLWSVTASAWANPAISKVSVHTQRELVTLDAKLIDAFSAKMTEAIESGVAMTFTFEIELRKEASFGDETVTQNKVTHTVQYDTLKKIYRFSSQGKNVNRKVETKTLEKYQELMLTLKNIPIAHVYKLDPEEKYYVRVKAEMEAEDLGFPFNYLLFFVPFKEFETTWKQSTPLTLKMDPAFGIEASKRPSKPGSIPAKGVGDGIRSFNQ